ncbi:unnamed protein product [Rotaria magnacalcarata]|uniref:Uncharacterized protein n=1 Tax=Rotaria magnacalcarata TaxID=392030 RepID=A0A816YBU4_9BILA|nr:unnamed protein product [Rotaria magnacalcarata]CAF2155598.1 unnamed protein product [Rotaria magnacalcarata]CAF2268940.1 unnamed protein product [Rotaria magnacalcarata]
MNQLQSEHVEPIFQPMAEFQRLVSKDNDDIGRKNDGDNEQAEIRRWAPTRHSIKAVSTRKTLTKQTSLTENKRKTAKNTTTSLSTSSETKHFPNVPSVSQIAPLPQNKSHSILPVLSLDGRDAPSSIQSEESETDLTSIATTPNNENGRHSHRVCLDPTTRRQYSYSQSSVLSEGILLRGFYLILEYILMDKSGSIKLVPGIYSTSLVDVDRNNVTTMYHPLKKEISPNELAVDSPTPYYYRSRTNSNIIQRRFSIVEQPTPTVAIEPVGKY